MSISSGRVTVGTTATALNTKDTAGNYLVIKNPSDGSDVDLGGSAVTSGGGFLLAAGDSVTVSLDSGDILYGIAAADAEISVLRL